MDALRTGWLDKALARARQMLARPELPSRLQESWRKLDLSLLDLNKILAAPAVSTIKSSRDAFEKKAVAPEAFQADLLESMPFAKICLQSEPNGNAAAGLRRPALFNQLFWLNPRGFFAAELRTQAEPFYFQHILEQGDWLATRLVLRVLEGQEVTIVEQLTAAGRLLCPVTDIILEEGARVNYISLSQPGPNSCYFHNFRADLRRDSSLRFYYFHSGGICGKNYYECDLNAPGAEFQATGIALGQGRQTSDLEMRLIHRASHTSSLIEYRTVLGGRSHSIYNGNLEIAQEVKQVASRQTNRNVILNNKARAESMPNLIIKAESVSCEHGATVGQLDASALLYLMSRGIPEDEARALLIRGFLDEVIAKIPEEQSASQVRANIEEALPAMLQEK
jgi:FeS assembly protein SufD